MKKIIITPEIYRAAPGFRELYIEADVVNGETQDELFAMIAAEGERLRGLLTIPEIAQRPAIAATRAAYKALGKEPNRYRPSAEALHRRMLQGKGLYRINALVDIINLLSLRYGYSIGGFDADKISGPTLTLGVGREGEPFEAIGRGPLNIACLPIFRDEIGGVGTPTSDNERTKMTPRDAPSRHDGKHLRRGYRRSRTHRTRSRFPPGRRQPPRNLRPGHQHPPSTDRTVRTHPTISATSVT